MTLLACSGVCWRAVAFVGVCWRLLVFVGVCLLVRPGYVYAVIADPDEEHYKSY